MLGLDRHATRYTWTVLVVLFLAWLVYVIRDTVFIFVVALLFAYLLSPLVDFLDRRLPGPSRVPALTVVYLALVVVLIVVGFVVGSRVEQEAGALASKLPEVVNHLQHLPASAPQQHPLVGTVEQQLASHSQDIVGMIPRAAIGLVTRAWSLIFIVLVPILSFFFLKDGRAMHDAILGFVAEGRYRNTIENIAEDLNVLLAQYMRALVILGLVASTAYGIVLGLLGVSYVALLAVVVFFLEFIPMVGPLIGGAIVLLVAGVGGSHHHLVAIILFLVVFRVFQDYVVSPQLMSAGMKLHPLLVIFGVLAGASIAGVAGSFLSVPVLATLRIVYRQLLPRTPGVTVV